MNKKLMLIVLLLALIFITALNVSAAETNEWTSAGEVKGAWLRLDFETKITANSIIIYPRVNDDDCLIYTKIEFSDGTVFEINEIIKGSAPKFIALNNPVNFTWVKIIIDGNENLCRNIGLDEFEIYASQNGTGENLSLRGTATASSYYNDDYLPSNVNSGIHIVSSDSVTELLLNPSQTNEGRVPSPPTFDERIWGIVILVSVALLEFVFGLIYMKFKNKN